MIGTAVGAQDTRINSDLPVPPSERDAAKTDKRKPRDKKIFGSQVSVTHQRNDATSGSESTLLACSNTSHNI